MDEINQKLTQIQSDLELLKSKSVEGTALGDWINRKTLLRFFDYSDSSLNALENNGEIEFSVHGHRKFYSMKSVIDFIERHKKIK